MKKALFYVLLHVPILAFSQQGDSAFKPTYSTVLDTSKGRLLVKQSPRQVPQKISAYWDVTEKEIEKLQKFFRKVTSIPASGAYLQGTRLPLSLDQFAFQYCISVHRRRHQQKEIHLYKRILPERYHSYRRL
jgi:hypothetical protein